ncbi:hypothetical protein N7453_001261 [Penicillium expansum]|nr:hypothetical protein N7453_001261 [Penicillium expansum]
MKQTCSQGWELKNIEDVRRHLHNFPWAQSWGKMFVNISPPVREDPGQTVQIWQKVTQLVDTLNTAPSALSVWVTLLEDWSSGEKPQQSIPYTTTTGYRPDHDIAILPFTYLSNWYYRTSPAYSATIENERELPRRSFLFKYGTDCALNEWRYITTGDFSNWHTDTRIFLDRKLDHLPGETAGALRLERFQNWFQDGWVSEYEAQFTADLQKHQNIVQKHDPGLVGVRRRHKLLILLHHIYHASNDDQEKVKAGLARMHPLVYEEWDSQFWSNCWGNYIPALSFQLIENRLAKQYWYRVYWNYRKFTVFGMILRGATSTTFNIHDSEWN